MGSYKRLNESISIKRKQQIVIKQLIIKVRLFKLVVLVFGRKFRPEQVIRLEFAVMERYGRGAAITWGSWDRRITSPYKAHLYKLEVAKTGSTALQVMTVNLLLLKTMEHCGPGVLQPMVV